MKICIISPMVIPLLGRKQRYGGIEVVVSTLAEELTKRGHDVLVYATGDSKIEAKIIPVAKKALGLGVSFEKEKTYNRKAYEMAIKEKPDVIWDNTLAQHAYTNKIITEKTSPEADISCLLSQLVNTKDIPVVHTLHGPVRDYLLNIAEKLSSVGHYLVSISKDQAIGYLNSIKVGQHLGTVYNPVDTDFFTPTKNKSNDYLMWVGRFGMEKGAHIALSAAQKAGMPITLIGKKLEKHEIEYFDKFVKPNLGPNDKFIEMADAQEKADLMRNARAVLMTNLWREPFGMVLAEAMACGTTVVGPAYGSLTELIDYAGVLIPINDLSLSENDLSVTEDHLKYIERVSQHIKEVDDIPSHVPRKRAEFLFSPKQSADGYEEAFFKAIYLKKKGKSLIE